MARTKQVRADVPALRTLVSSRDVLIDLRPIVAVIMHYSGCTYDEIGQVFDTSRQAALALVKQAKRESDERGSTEG